MACCHCEAVESLFDAKQARKDAERYRKKGPDRTTELMLEAIRDSGLRSVELLDVGGGVGAISLELFGEVARSATHVDASTAYLEAAAGECEREGKPVRFVHGDFVELAPDIDPADVVTLDRVVCCYPDLERLVSASSAKATKLYVASYPRQRWYVRLALALENAVQRLKGSAFRAYLHPPARIAALLSTAGLTPLSTRRTPFWEVVAYSREQP